jgi:hypothetical protein
MRAQPLGAVLSVSVDLPVVAADSGGCQSGTLERLFGLFAAAGQPVTWFADDPAANETIRQVLATDGGHEAGLRVDADRGGRNRLVAELVGGAARARRAGIRITTLAIDRAAAELPAELLVKHGMTAVRAPADANRARSGAIGPAPLRYGLWRIASDFRLVGGSWIADRLTTRRIRRAIDRCIRSETPLHLAIDVAAIAVNSGPERLGGLPAILRHVERRRSAGLLRVCTIAEVVARLAAPAAPRAAGSILRAA